MPSSLVTELPDGVALNVNVPPRDYADLRGVRRAPLATFGAVQLTIAERDEGYLRLALTDRDVELEPGTDEHLLSHGYVTVTPLRPLSEAADVDVALGRLTSAGYRGPAR